jgi:hypothetical protein
VSEAITSWRIASQGLTWKANDLSGNGSALRLGAGTIAWGLVS